MAIYRRHCAECSTSFETRAANVVYCSSACGDAARARCALPDSARRLGRDGYMRRGKAYEHRLVMELKIGRRLTRDEAVHHVNGDKTDNRPENLELMTRGRHVALHNAIAPKRARTDVPIVHASYTPTETARR